MELTLAEFARQCGISRQAVYKAADPPGSPGDGLFPCYQTGRGRCVNTDETRTREYQENVLARKTDTPGPPSVPKKPKKKAVRHRTVGARSKKKEKTGATVGAAAAIPDIPDHLKSIIDSGDLTFEQALALSKTDLDKIKIYEDIKTRHQAREEKRHEMVQRRLIRGVFGRLYEIDNTQFLTLKTKIIPDLLSIMSESVEISADMVGKKIEVFTGNRPETITAADKIIDDNCYKILDNIKREINKFLRTVKNEPISSAGPPDSG